MPIETILIIDDEVAITEFFQRVAAARGFVKKAQSGRPRTLRGALTRAKIARATDDSKTALRLYHRILDENSYLIAEALPRLVEIYEGENSAGKLEKSIRSLLKNNPEMSKDIAYAAIVNDIADIPAIDECVEEYMLNEPTLAEFIDLQKLDDGSRHDAMVRVRVGLSKLAASTPLYQCRECGFSSKQLLWQCPSCKDWETQRPYASVQFDSVLQRSGIST